jgi:hypothetical protein
VFRRVLPPLAAALALSGLAACSGDTAASDGDGAGAQTQAVAPEDAVEGVAWEKVAGTGECACSDGTEFHYWLHEGDPTKVAFVLEGGGACFSAETCAPGEGATFTPNLSENDGEPRGDSGILDLTNPENPLAGASIVYVPYCTGDLHLGDRTQDYGGGVTVQHKGRVNATTALEGMAREFPDAEEVVVLGFSAGSAGAPLYGGLAHDLLPDADIKVIADASGAYPADEAITGAIGGLWGIFDSLPAWPEAAGQPATAWSLPGLFVQTGRHVPGVALATVDTANDAVQRRFSDLIGFSGTPLPELIDRNARFIESAGVEVSSWVGAGTQHVNTASDEVLYGSEVEGTALIDWIRDFLAGEDVPDVRCAECD